MTNKDFQQRKLELLSQGHVHLVEAKKLLAQAMKFEAQHGCPDYASGVYSELVESLNDFIVEYDEEVDHVCSQAKVR